jgi:methylthioxylose transferase
MGSGGSAAVGPEGPVNERPPYVATAVALLAVLGVSQAIPFAKHAFGGNVPPLFARLSPSAGPWIVLAIVLVTAAWFGLPRLLEASVWTFLAGIVAFGLALALALSVQAHGIQALAAPLRGPLDYDASVPLLRSIGLRSFVEHYPQLRGLLSLHARTHPPGAVIFLWAASRLFGDNLTAVAILIALIGVLGAVPTYLLARYVYGDRAARLAAALFVCAPGVLLFSATSMDAVFMTVGAVVLAALVRAPRSDGWAFAAGGALALALGFTFGVLTFGLVATGLAVIAWEGGGRAETNDPVRAPLLMRRALVGLAGLVAGVLVLRLLIGLDLIAVFRSTVSAHLVDPSRRRPYAYWLFADIPAVLIVAGLPQTALLAAEARSAWRRGIPRVETVLLATLALASISGVFLGEVDHIWLFFIPLVAAPAGAALSRTVERGEGSVITPLGWALAQAVVMQVLLFTFW